MRVPGRNLARLKRETTHELATQITQIAIQVVCFILTSL